MTEIRITPTPQHLGFGYEVRLIDGEAESFATSIQMRTNGEIGEEIPALFTLTRAEVQEWIDTLWSLGVRPSNGAGDANAMEALTRWHLSDMRALVFVDKVEPKK
jgi:hypothetical protein